MGFWKAAGKLAAEVAKDALSSAREVKVIHDRLEDKSSAELRKITTEMVFSAALPSRKSAWLAAFCVTGTTVNDTTGPGQALFLFQEIKMMKRVKLSTCAKWLALGLLVVVTAVMLPPG